MAVAFALSGVGTYLLLRALDQKPVQHTLAIPERIGAGDPSCSYSFKRMNGFREIGPLISAELDCEAPRFNGLKQRLNDLVGTEVNRGILTDISIHLQDLMSSEWMVINDSSRFSPMGSLRVPLMIHYYQLEEREPGTMMSKVRFTERTRMLPRFTLAPPTSLVAGREYTIGDLLRHAVKDNDQVAASILVTNARPGSMIDVIRQVGVPENCVDTIQDRLRAREYSLFWKALVHGAALSLRHSEEALDMLIQSSFPLGLEAGLPPGTPVANRFGETLRPGEAQLRESGIVYLDGTTYLLTVMTKGPELMPLTGVLKRVSEVVYAEMVKPRQANGG